MYSGSQKDEVRCWAEALKRLGGYVSCQSYLIFLRNAIFHALLSHIFSYQCNRREFGEGVLSFPELPYL